MFRRLSFLALAVAVLSLSILNCHGNDIQAQISDLPGKNADESRWVFLLNSYHKGYDWTDEMVEAIATTLREANPGLILVTDYMDARRYPGYRNLFELAMLYLHKYRETKFDLVICTDDQALDLMLSYGDFLFPETPIVYSGVAPRDSLMNVSEKMTGVTKDDESKRALDLVFRILPETEKVYFPCINCGYYNKNPGIGTFNGNGQVLPDIDFIDIKKSDLSEIANQSLHLEKSSAVLISESREYSNGGGVLIDEKLDIMMSAMDIPAFTTLNHLVKQNRAVGGSVYNAEEIGTTAAEIALRILGGEAPGEILPVEAKSFFAFSDPLLTSFDINRKLLPEEKVIYNRKVSFFERNKDIIIINILIALFLIIMAVYMVLNIKKRKKAQIALNAEKEFMERLFQNSPEGIVLLDENDRIFRMNNSMAEMFKLKPDEAEGEKINDMVADSEELAPEAEAFSRRSMEGNLAEVETLRRRSDGTVFPVSVIGMPFNVDGERMVYGIYRDITRQKSYENSLKERLNFEEFISSISSSLVLNSDINGIIGTSLEELSCLIGANRGYIALTDPELKSMEIIHEWMKPGQFSLMEYKGGKLCGLFPGIVETLINTGQLLIEDIWYSRALLKKEEREILAGAGITSLIIFPMYKEGKIFGITTFCNPWEKHLWDSSDVNMLRTFRDIISEAFQRKDSEAELKKNLSSLQTTLEETITALGKILEVRDPYIAGHQKRVSTLAVAIARELGFTSRSIKGVYYACLLHDIGKINIPSEILNKPGKLSEIEKELVQRHPLYGWEILRNIEFPWPVAEIVLHHHEHYDGTGYPHGLKCDEIPLESRIIAVADMVEAISSERPYRPATSISSALDAVSGYSGTFYDPEVVEVCINLFSRKGFIFPVVRH